MIVVGTALRMANGRGAVVEAIEPLFHETVRKPDGTSEDRRIPYAYLRYIGLSSWYPIPVKCLEEKLREGRIQIVE